MSPRTVVALDVETADAQHTRICSIALVRIEGNQIAGEWSSLVRPPEPPAPRNVGVHGLSWAKLHDAPPFADVWKIVLGLLDGADAVVAHWAKFDREALAKNCAAEGARGLDLPWICTVELARKAWPQLPSAKLPVVAEHLKLELQHHDALSDARCCAQIYLAAAARLSPAAASPVLAPAPSPAPLPIAGEERVGTEGATRWVWTSRAGYLSLQINDRLLLEVVETGEASSIKVHGPRGDLLSLTLATTAAPRLDGLLMEALRVVVIAARLRGIQLSAESWKKLVEGRTTLRRAA